MENECSVPTSPWIVGLCAVVFERIHGAMVCEQWPPADGGASSADERAGGSGGACALSDAEKQAIAFHALPVRSPGA